MKFRTLDHETWEAIRWVATLPFSSDDESLNALITAAIRIIHEQRQAQQEKP